MKKIVGLIVNPIAGIGGRVGLKGSNGKEIVKKAKELGGEAIAPKKAIETLIELDKISKNLDIKVVAYAGEMGEDECKKAKWKDYEVIGSIQKGETTFRDTIKAAKLMNEKVDLILFSGGDGTARDLVNANISTPCLGIPSGVKIYSAVFAVNSLAAAKTCYKFLKGELNCTECEVLDIDEQAYRKGKLQVKLYGYLKVPKDEILVQDSKSPTFAVNDELENMNAIARYLAERIKDDKEHAYILAPGSTVKALGNELKVDKTLLGVDVYYNGRLVVKDCGEKEILEAIKGKKAKIVLTPIGGQGFIFGRGNQQISPIIIKKVGKDGIIVLATRSKISRLKRLRVDTGDKEVDNMLKGYIRVIVDYGMEEVRKLE
jgi:predicted polyphosphate/ATP-dependent NAD kinase